METFPAFLRRHGFGVVAGFFERHQRTLEDVLPRNREYFMFISEDRNIIDDQRQYYRVNPEAQLDFLLNRIANVGTFTQDPNTIRMLDRTIYRVSFNKDWLIDGLESFAVAPSIVYASPDYTIQVKPIEGRARNPQPLNPDQPMQFEDSQRILAAIVEKLRRLIDAEYTNYGATTASRDLHLVWRQVRHPSFNVKLNVDPVEFATLIDRVNLELQQIEESQHVLGRRCLNSRDFGDGSKIFEAREAQPGLDIVPANEFIRLRNKVCWDMDSLMNFIIMQNGYNSITDPKTGLPYTPFLAYPGVTKLWQDDEEL